MKKLLNVLLSCSLLLVGCGKKDTQSIKETEKPVETPVAQETPAVQETKELNFYGLNDPALLEYTDKEVYKEVIEDLDSDEYYVSDIQTCYISQAYLEELQFNSQENVFFGYTVSELEKQFKGEKYVFTLGEDGTTVVKQFQAIEPENVYKKMATDVAVGAGVILVTATVASLTVEAAPAVSVILAVGAKTGTAYALSTGAVSAVIGGAAEAFNGGDVEDSLKAMAVSGCEGVKIGAITGTLAGSAQAGLALKAATKSGLTMNQAAKIQQETKWSTKFIEQIHSPEEAEIYKNAGLQKMNIDGREVYANPEFLNRSDELGRTNLERLKQGLNPIGEKPVMIDGKETIPSMEWHHVGQRDDGTLALLERVDHNPNGDILNWRTKTSEIDRAAFNKEKKVIMKKIAEAAEKGVLFD